MKFATFPLLLASLTTVIAAAEGKIQTTAKGQKQQDRQLRGRSKSSKRSSCSKGSKSSKSGSKSTKRGSESSEGRSSKSSSDSDSSEGTSEDGASEIIDCVDNVMGTIWTVSNDATENALVKFHQRDDGTLCGPVARYPTGGIGFILEGPNAFGIPNVTGAIASQDSVLVGEDWALVPNTGSMGPDGLSLFRNTEVGWVVADTADTGGNYPHAVGKYGDLVYVANAEGNLFAPPAEDAVEGTFTGFRITAGGTQLTPVPDSTRTSPPNAISSQISFSLDGKHLIVSYLRGREVRVYEINSDGSPSEDFFSVVSPGPFAFEQVDIGGENYVFVAEFLTGAVSSYKLESDGTLTTVSQSVACKDFESDENPATEQALCWIRYRANYLYGINAGSGGTSIWKFDDEGEVKCAFEEITEGAQAGFHDAHIQDDKLYVLTVNNADLPQGEITGYQIDNDGGLTLIEESVGPAMTGYGLDGFLL